MCGFPTKLTKTPAPCPCCEHVPPKPKGAYVVVEPNVNSAGRRVFHGATDIRVAEDYAGPKTLRFKCDGKDHFFVILNLLSWSVTE